MGKMRLSNGSCHLHRKPFAIIQQDEWCDGIDLYEGGITFTDQSAAVVIKHKGSKFGFVIRWD
jgi:hypothetical protein